MSGGPYGYGIYNEGRRVFSEGMRVLGVIYPIGTSGESVQFISKEFSIPRWPSLVTSEGNL